MKNKASSRSIVHLTDSLLESRAQSWFIAGTDTGVGKTFLTEKLLREFQHRNLPAVGFKPICCGDRDDARRLRRASSGKFTLTQINPIHLPHPVAPIAQKCPSWSDLSQKILKAFRQISNSKLRPYILVEGAGGVLCPITQDKTLRDLMKELRIPIIVVALDKLGALNHTLLTLESIAPLKCAGVVLNRRSDKKMIAALNNGVSLEQITRIRVFSMP